MSRPGKWRHIKCKTNAHYFKPRGIPLVDLEKVAEALIMGKALKIVTI